MMAADLRCRPPLYKRGLGIRRAQGFLDPAILPEGIGVEAEDVAITGSPSWPRPSRPSPAFPASELALVDARNKSGHDKFRLYTVLYPVGMKARR
jgi:hypothetical protein